MQTGALTGYFDVAQITLYAFWIFFAGLIFYLSRENKREGYTNKDFLNVPAPKAFVLADGSVAYAPRPEKEETVNAFPIEQWEGSAREPIGDPMLAEVGPGAYAQHRPDYPDHTFDDGLAKIVPLRTLPDFWLANEDPNPHGMEVMGVDNVVVGKIVDSWIDRSEVVIRYWEVELTSSGDHVLLPQHFAQISNKRRQVKVGALMGKHFDTIPRLKHPETVTLLEEEKLVAYFGGGMLYATAKRTEPLL